MKTLLQTSLLTLSTVWICTAQTDISLSPSVIRTTDFWFQGGNPPHSWYQEYPVAEKVGHSVGAPNADETWRSLYKFDLTQIPSSAFISRARLRTYVTDYSLLDNYFAYTGLLPDAANAVLYPSPTSDQQVLANRFNTVGSVIVYQRYNVDTLVDVLASVNASRGDGYIIFSGRSNDEQYSNSNAILHVELKVTYVSAISITFQNNFPGGIMNINGNSGNSLPYTKSDVHFGDVISLVAVAQVDNAGYDCVWNDYAPVNRSKWRKYVGGNPSDVSTSASYSFSPNLGDNNATYQAELKRNYKVTRNDETEFDGTFYGAGETRVVDQNTGSILAPATKTVNNRDYRFYAWSDGVTANPRNVTPNDNVTLTARYKAHLLSSNQAASSYNNQRKIGYVGGRYHMVYCSSGKIWYCNSTDDGATWGPEVRLSDGSGLSRMPSLAINRRTSSGQTWMGVTWERFDPSTSTSDILLSKVPLGSLQWPQTATLVSTMDAASGFAGATPVLTLDPNLETIVWSANPTWGFSPGLYMWVNDLTHGYPDSSITIVPGTDGNSKYPSSCEDPNGQYTGRVALAWAQNGSIRYCYNTYNFVHESMSFGTIEETSALGSSYSSHNYPSLTFDFQSGAPRPVVAWEAHYVPTEMEVVLERRRESGGWGTATRYSNNDFQYFQPSITNYQSSTNLAMTWYDDNNPSGLRLAKYTGSWGTATTLSGNGQYPVLGYDADPYTNKLRILYTSGTAAPYALATTAQGLPKEAAQLTEELQRAIVVSSQGVDHVVTLHSVLLEGSQPTSISFEPYADVDQVTSAANATKFLSIGPFTVSTTSALSFALDSWTSCPDSIRDGIGLVTRLRLTDLLTGADISSYLLDTLTVSKKGFLTQTYTANLAGLSGRTISASIALEVIGSSAIRWVPLMIHHETKAGVDRSGTPKVALGPAKRIPDSYALDQSYPNPFNPTTTINFELPENASIELIVYDVLGRVVTPLVNGSYEAGYHSVIWDARAVASGVYYARLTATDEHGKVVYSRVNKLLLMR